MRLALAIGILSQTALSQDVATTSQSAENKNVFRKLVQNVPQGKNNKRLIQDHQVKKKNELHNRRILLEQATRSKNSNSSQRKSPLRSSASEVLKNEATASSSSTHAGQTLCNPESPNADIGVLSCGDGKVCKASKDSLLGGVCVAGLEKKPSKSGSGSSGGSSSTTARRKESERKRRMRAKKKAFPKARKVGGVSGVLKNMMLARGTRKECDPHSFLSVEPDLGVLSPSRPSCPEGHDCQESASSQLGGICVPKTTTATTSTTTLRASSFPGDDHRGLEPSTVRFCEKLSLNYDCDCETAYNKQTGTGNITCAGSDYCFKEFNSGCNETCGDYVMTYAFDSFAPIWGSVYYHFKTAYEQKTFYMYGMDGSCTFSVDGEACDCDEGFVDCNNTAAAFVGLPVAPILQSCVNVCDFCGYYAYAEKNKNVTVPDFGNINCNALQNLGFYGSIADEQCATVRPLMNETCCNSDCNICGNTGAYLNSQNANAKVTIPGLGEYTCNDLYNAGVQGGTIPKEKCPAARSAAFATCCTKPEFFCRVCDYHEIAVNPDTLIDVPSMGEATCNYFYSSGLNGDIPEDVCPQVQSVAKETCCKKDVSCDRLCGYDDGYTLPKFAKVTLPDVGELQCDEFLEGVDGFGVNVADYFCGSCCVEIPYSCDLCGLDKVLNYPDNIISIPEVGEFTCQEGYNAAMSSGAIGKGHCPLVQTYFVDTCCGEPMSVCNVCGDNHYVAYPDTTVSVSGQEDMPCSALNAMGVSGTLPTSACPEAKVVGAGSCCLPFPETCDLCGDAKVLKSAGSTWLYQGVQELSCTDSYNVALATGLGGSCKEVRAMFLEPCCQDPTDAPSRMPTASPTDRPTDLPTDLPTDTPSAEPTGSPSAQPQEELEVRTITLPKLTSSPTSKPSKAPSASPTKEPTPSPTTKQPTEEPSSAPSTEPSASPTAEVIPEVSPRLVEPTDDASAGNRVPFITALSSVGVFLAMAVYYGAN